MKLTVLGSGCAVPHPLRASAGFWLATDGGTILLDCSAAAVHRMAQENFDWAALDAIWISHFHLDHCGGLAPFLFATRHAPQTKDRTKPLRIFGGKGMRKLLEDFDKAGGYKLFDQPFPLEVIEVEPLQKWEILPGISAAAISTPHKPESMAIRLTDTRGTSLVYTADTGMDMTIGDFARRADLLVMECSFFENKPVPYHLELTEAMHLVRYAEPRRVMLTHFYPEWDAYDVVKECEKFSPRCEVIEATDGLVVLIDN
jgi:ribonuclease BN (tRNA processing enzyme)